MKTFGTLSAASTLEMPDLTPEQWAENDRAVSEWEAGQARAARAEALRAANIPADYAGADGAMPEVVAWADDPTKGLLLQGEVGRGKTHNACAALARNVENGGTSLFTTFDDLLRECRAAFGGDTTELAVVGRHASVGMLCIDDMGKERLTEWSLPIVFSIVNKRSMNLKPTVVTTQYTGAELLRRMTVGGDVETARAIISRMMEYTRVEVVGPDRRRS